MAIEVEELKDHRSARIVKLAEKRIRAGTNVVPGTSEAEEVEESSTNVIDLMEVLKARLQGKLRARATPANGAGKRTGARDDKLGSKSKAKLYAMAQSLDVPGRSAMSKAELIDALAGQPR